MLHHSVVSFALLAVSLGGCATVSMVPGSTIVETKVSGEQENLRTAAVAFGQTAETRGWIAESRNFFDLARVLVDGQTSASETAETSYAYLIGAETRDQADVARTIAVDAHDAAAALELVSSAAKDFLSIQLQARDRAARSDLVSFERALVQAQQARRAFVEAVVLADVGSDEALQIELQRFDAEIDVARSIADELSTEYSGRDVSTVVS